MAQLSSTQQLSLIAHRNSFLVACFVLTCLYGFWLLLALLCSFIQDPDWRQRLKNFDAVFAPVANTQEPAQAPAVTVNTNPDLEKQTVPTSETLCDAPPSLTAEEFQTKHPTLVATVTLNVGANLTCCLAEDKVYIMSGAKITLPGLKSQNPRPLFLYAGGSWISESGKDRVLLCCCLCGSWWWGGWLVGWLVGWL